MASNNDELDYDPERTRSWLVCTACGTQFPTADAKALTTCRICDDPRQFTPSTGQDFTTLDALRAAKHKNVFAPFANAAGKQFISISSEPKIAIGQRAVLIRTPRGNVLWDCITLLDDETITHVNKLGGLKAIVISHPHYYSTHVEWARAFQCPVYLAAEDKEWMVQSSPWQRFVTETEFVVPLGSDAVEDDPAGEVKVLKLGGHFPGSFVALYDKRLLIADTLVTTPAGRGNWDTDAAGQPRALSDSAVRDPPTRRPLGMNSFSFMWSIPNMIPLSADEIAGMWAVLKGHAFSSTHGAFVGLDVESSEEDLRKRVLESMQIQIRHMGNVEHKMLEEK